MIDEMCLLSVLIRKLRDWAEYLETGMLSVNEIQAEDLIKLLRKTAEALELQHECIEEQIQEKYQRGLDSVLEEVK